MSNNLSRVEITASQNQKEVTANDSDGILDAAITETITLIVDETNSITITASQWTQNVMFVFDDTSPAPTADFDVYVPATTRGFFTVTNATTFTATIQISGQALTPPTVAAGDTSLMTCDGSNVVKPAAGASTFAIGDATDVDTSSPTPVSGQFLMFDGSVWASADVSVSLSLDDMTDVDASSPAPTQGDILRYDGSIWTASGMPYDIPLSFSGTPSTASPLLGKVMIVRGLVFPENFAGSYGHVGTNPSITYDIDVQDDGVSIGTISIDTGGGFTFSTSSGTSKTVAAGSRLEFYGPDGSPTDWTISDIAVTLMATVTS